jgi:hypothetical protein
MKAILTFARGWNCLAAARSLGRRGTSLRPLPPGNSKQKEVRILDAHEDDQLDEAQFATG